MMFLFSFCEDFKGKIVVGRMMELSVFPSVTEIVIISLIVVVRAVV